VGDVARFGFSRKWGALQGRRVLLTCSATLQDEACREVRDAGGFPISMPLIQMTLTPEANRVAAVAADYDWLVATSPSAVRSLVEGLRESGGDLRRWPSIMACGPGTLRELAAAGVQADAVPTSGFGAEGLLPLAQARITKGARVLRVRSDKAGPSLAEKLREQGAEVDDVCIYRNEPVAAGDLPGFDSIFFASSSAVSAFVDVWGTGPLSGKTVLAIGQPTASALKSAGVTSPLVSPEATVKDAIACLAADSVGTALTQIR